MNGKVQLRIRYSNEDTLKFQSLILLLKNYVANEIQLNSFSPKGSQEINTIIPQIILELQNSARKKTQGYRIFKVFPILSVAHSIL